MRDIAVIALWAVPFALELEDRVRRGIFSVKDPVSLSPLDLAWVALHLEVFVALGAAKTENL